MRDCVRCYIDKKTGIKVTVTQHENRYDVEIVMPEGTFNNAKNVHIESKELSLSATAVNCELPWHGPYAITLNKGYQSGKYGFIKNVQSTIKFEGRNCFGSITLNPKFYIPTKKRATSKKIKKAREVEKLGTLYISGRSKSTSSKYIPYTRTNITKPYNGGRVSPK